MRYLSVCSGIEAASVAWHPLGWLAAGFSEIEAFPRAVLKHRFPDVPLHGDFTKLSEADVGAIDLLVGGTPCQSFSVAGRRAGLDDPRGILALEFLNLARRLRPRWLVWENVPGVLSLDEGRAFGAILGLLGELGYGWAYRKLDAQYVRVDGFCRAVPQRRQRVFVVGYLGDWRPPAAVLLEPESLRGDSPPRREAGERVADHLTVGANQYSGFCGEPVAHALNAHGGPHGCIDAESETFVAHSLTGEGFDASEDGTGRGTPLVPIPLQEIGGRKSKNQNGIGMGVGKGDDPMYTLQSGQQHGVAVAFQSRASASRSMNPNDETAPALDVGKSGGLAVAFAENQRHEIREMDVVPALNSGGGKPGRGYPAVAFDMRGREDGSQPEGPHDTANMRAPSGGSSRSYVAEQYAVRRLTSRECERLQGFPDDWTLVPYRNGTAKDGPRYKALGNAMAVNVMRWIGMRIDMAAQYIRAEAA